MWGLSMNLCLPYASVFMLALGLNDLQVGITASIYMFSQMIFSLLSGIITDKLGRRLTTAVFDFIAWSVPCLIWAFAENFWFFAVAAVFNGAMKITTVSWDCLLIEDAEKHMITRIYSWVIICGNLSALFAPIASILVSRLTLVPAVRILYINAFVVMTLKLVILYFRSKETRQGAIRVQETSGQSVLTLLAGYKDVIRQMFKSQGILFSVIVSVLVEIIAMINLTFWQIIASKRIGVSDQWLPLFPMLRSVIAIVFFFTIISRINQSKLKFPLIAGYSSAFTGSLILILLPQGIVGYIGLIVSLIFDSLGSALLATLRESIVALQADPHERSRVMAVLHTFVMLVSVPFGYIAGLLSEYSRALPFALNMVLLLAGIVTALVYFSREQKILECR
jgi:MFS family permease